MDISEYLKNRGFSELREGYSKQIEEQVKDLINLVNNEEIKEVMEIGFNGGHSAELFLKNNININLTSFDLGRYAYVEVGKEYIDKTYPERHKLILGDSTKTIPQFINNNKDKKFDLIFIDGGHLYEIAKSDMDNCYLLAHKNTIVAVDDIVNNKKLIKNWNIGPTRSWNEYLQNNKITELYRKDYRAGRGMSVGKYNF